MLLIRDIGCYSNNTFILYILIYAQCMLKVFENELTYKP